MKKLVSVIGFLVLALGSVIAQDTLSIFEVADTSLAVIREGVSSLPSGSSFKDWILWGVSVLALVLGLLNYFKGKKIVK